MPTSVFFGTNKLIANLLAATFLKGQNMTSSLLQSTQWLAKRLGLSVTTIERLRAQGSTDIPQHITIGSSIKYDEASVEAWIQARFQPSATLPMERSQS